MLFSTVKRADLPTPRIPSTTVSKITKKAFALSPSRLMQHRKRKPMRLTIVPPEGIEFLIKQASHSYSRGKGIVEIFQTTCLLKRTTTTSAKSSSYTEFRFTRSTSTFTAKGAAAGAAAVAHIFSKGFPTISLPRPNTLGKKSAAAAPTLTTSPNNSSKLAACKRPIVSFSPDSSSSDVAAAFASPTSTTTPRIFEIPSTPDSSTCLALPASPAPPTFESTPSSATSFNISDHVSHDYSLKLGELLASFEQYSRPSSAPSPSTPRKYSQPSYVQTVQSLFSHVPVSSGSGSGSVAGSGFHLDPFHNDDDDAGFDYTTAPSNLSSPTLSLADGIPIDPNDHDHNPDHHQDHVHDHVHDHESSLSLSLSLSFINPTRTHFQTKELATIPESPPLNEEEPEIDWHASSAPASALSEPFLSLFSSLPYNLHHQPAPITSPASFQNYTFPDTCKSPSSPFHVHNSPGVKQGVTAASCQVLEDTLDVWESGSANSAPFPSSCALTSSISDHHNHYNLHHPQNYQQQQQHQQLQQLSFSPPAMSLPPPQLNYHFTSETLTFSDSYEDPICMPRKLYRRGAATADLVDCNVNAQNDVMQEFAYSTSSSGLPMSLLPSSSGSCSSSMGNSIGSPGFQINHIVDHLGGGGLSELQIEHQQQQMYEQMTDNAFGMLDQNLHSMIPMAGVSESTAYYHQMASSLQMMMPGLGQQHAQFEDSPTMQIAMQMSMSTSPQQHQHQLQPIQLQQLQHSHSHQHQHQLLGDLGSHMGGHIDPFGSSCSGGKLEPLSSSSLQLLPEDVVNGKDEEGQGYTPESSPAGGENESGDDFSDFGEDQLYFPLTKKMMSSSSIVAQAPLPLLGLQHMQTPMQTPTPPVQGTSSNQSQSQDKGKSATTLGADRDQQQQQQQPKRSKGTKAWTNHAVVAGQHVFLMSQNSVRLSKAVTGKKGKYYCTHCPNQFRTTLDLGSHMDEVLIVRPFHCTFVSCPWYVTGFPTASEWCRHTRSQHGRGGSNMLRCEGCGKKFARKDSLKRHAQLVHDNSNSRFNRKMRKMLAGGV